MTKFDLQNALAFGNLTRRDFKNFWDPIGKIFGFTDVAYHKIRSSGLALSLCTSQRAHSYYLTYVMSHGLYFPRHICNVSKTKPYYFLWNARNDSDFSRPMLNMKLWNGFNVYMRDDGCLELFVFMTDPDNDHFQNHCLNHITEIECLTHYFKNKFNHIIKNEEFFLAHFNGMFEHTNTEIDFNIEDVLNIKNVPFLTGKDLCFLTKKESLCVSLFAKGFTCKEVAQKIHISPRTVETHLNNIKIKSGIHHKSDLIKFCHKSCNTFIRKIAD